MTGETLLVIFKIANLDDQGLNKSTYSLYAQILFATIVYHYYNVFIKETYFKI